MRAQQGAQVIGSATSKRSIVLRTIAATAAQFGAEEAGVLTVDLLKVVEHPHHETTSQNVALHCSGCCK